MLRKKKSSFQVDLRFHGVSQDDIYKGGERMTEMQNLLDRPQEGYRDTSNVKDLKQEGVSNVFSEKSERKLWLILSCTNLKRNSQDNSMSYLLEAFLRTDHLLRMW